MPSKQTRRLSVPPAAAKEAKRLKDQRPQTQVETAFIAGMALALKVPRGWLWDDEACEFLPPTAKKEKRE